MPSTSGSSPRATRASGEPPHDEAYGARTFDMVDPFGHRWMIQTPIADPSIEEIEAGMEGYTITAAPDRPPPAGRRSRSAT